MSDEAKALAERLEEWEWTLRAAYKGGDLGTDEPALLMGEAADRIEALEAENERLRGLLREAEVKLTDVQGAYATKRYADNLLARISAALQETSHD